MNETEKQKLNWLKIMTAGVIAMLVLLLVFTICMLGMVRTLRAYETRIDAVLTRAEIVSADLEALDTAGMVSAVNGISEQLRDADIATTLDSLQKTAKELEDIDWKDMSTTINEAAVQAKISLEQAEETMIIAKESMEKLDVDSLTEAVEELRDAVAPLSALGSLFR